MTPENQIEERAPTLAEKLAAKAEALKERPKEFEEVTIILIDSSGSMSDYCKNGMTKMAAVKQAIPLLQAKGSWVEYGLAGFGSEAYLVQGPTANFQAIRLQADLLSPSGSTNMTGGMRMSLGMVTEIPSKRRRIIMLSDGEESFSKLDVLKAADACTEMRTIVDTIGFGSNPDEALLKEIARRTGGKYYRADDPLALEGAYRELNFQMRYLEHK